MWGWGVKSEVIDVEALKVVPPRVVAGDGMSRRLRCDERSTGVLLEVSNARGLAPRALK